jgi:hypothetical protein
MKINYKEPYWVKYEWDLEENKDNQYVTEFNKKDSPLIHNLFHEKRYALNVEFKLNKRYKSDNIYCIFGKPGKNFGLTYNKEADILALEFWTQGSTAVSDDEFHYIKFYDTHYDTLKDWVNITIIRNDDEFIVYKNFDRNNDKDFDKNLIDDYRYEGILIGTGNPGSGVPEHRYHGSFDIKKMFFVKNIIDIDVVKEIAETDSSNLNKLEEYKNIIFNHEFDTVNNEGIVFDNSENTFFAEKIPSFFVK